MTEVRLVTEAQSADAVVVWFSQRDGTLELDAGSTGLGRVIQDRFGQPLTETLTTLGATGAEGEVFRIPALGALGAPLLLAAGLGSEDDSAGTPERFRRAAGNAARALGTQAVVEVACPEGRAGDITEGWLLGSYRFDRYKSAAPEVQAELRLITDSVTDEAGDVERARIIGQSCVVCRDLVNTPGSDLYPAAFAELAEKEAQDLDLEVEVWDDQRLRDEGFGGLVGVGQGSMHPSRLVRLSYRPPAGGGLIALVGKGITFDSGGLSIKPSDSMATMKGDMAGAAAVLAVMVAAARLQLPVALDGWLALAENMPSGTAIRPSDVLRLYGGTTVEVANTDAEGRLVLGDAIARAAEASPETIIDIATLTGAHVPAIGADFTAVVSNDVALSARLMDAGHSVGEQLWPLPPSDQLGRSLRRAIDSKIADLRNMGEPGIGKLATSALFLEHFVPEGTSWAHLDIAGPSNNRGEPKGYQPGGPTAVPVRTLLAYLTALT